MNLVAATERGGGLCEAVGDAAIERDVGVRIDGNRFALRVTPADDAALARALALLDASHASAVVVGGGSRADLGNPPTGAEILLSTAALDGIRELDVDDGVVDVRAGTRIAELRSAARAEGWEVPLDPWGASATVGGAIAAAAFGPRRQGFGAVRDGVLGLHVSLPSGERTHCGGRVVKNVTGYDLAKLYTGSFGTLGVIESAWLRLRPLPETAAVLAGQVSAVSDALAAGLEVGLEAARRPTARALAMMLEASRPGTGAQWQLTAEFAGEAPAVDEDVRWFESTCAGRPVARCEGRDFSECDAGVEVLRRRQGGPPGNGDARFRLSVPPSRLPEPVQALRSLIGDGAAMLVYPGLGLVYGEVSFPPAPRGEAEASEEALLGMRRILDGVAHVGVRCNGEVRWEVLPTWAKAERDVFSVNADTLPIMRALKQRFDPNRILNPGRFAGGL